MSSNNIYQNVQGHTLATNFCFYFPRFLSELVEGGKPDDLMSNNSHNYKMTLPAESLQYSTIFWFWLFSFIEEKYCIQLSGLVIQSNGFSFGIDAWYIQPYLHMNILILNSDDFTP